MLLAIETVGSPWGFAVAGPKGLVGEFAVAGQPSEALVADLQALLPLWGLGPAAVTALAVVVGPGQYMGVRAGVTVARTLAQVWQKPLLGLDAAAVLALQAPVGSLVLVVLDVRRGEVYGGLGRRTAVGVDWIEPLALRRWAEWREALTTGAEPVLVLGDVAALSWPVTGHWRPAPADVARLRPATVALAGWQMLQAGAVGSYLDVQPFYVRAAVP